MDFYSPHKQDKAVNTLAKKSAHCLQSSACTTSNSPSLPIYPKKSFKYLNIIEVTKVWYLVDECLNPGTEINCI